MKAASNRFLFKLNHAGFEDALAAQSWSERSDIGPRSHTMGARMISSYARSPYFSAGLSGRRTTKSYKLSATSLCFKRKILVFVSKACRVNHRRTSARVHNLDFKSSMTFQSCHLAKLASRYGKDIWPIST